MAVILLFVLIQTYRFATISSMTIGVAKLAERGLMILTINLPANFVINWAGDQISILAKAGLLVTIDRPKGKADFDAASRERVYGNAQFW
jgi:hypothetical protein